MARVRTRARGRDDELDTIRAEFERSAGGGRLVVVRGPAGIGRSSLLESAAAVLRSAGAWILPAVVDDGDQDSGDVYGVGAVLTAGRAAFERFGDFQLADSVTVLTRLRTIVADNPGWWVPRLANEVGALFDRIGVLHRCALLIDDVDTVPDPVLVFGAARRPGCLVVLTCRDEVEPSVGMIELLTLADAVIDLRPLADDQVEAMMTRAAGVTLDDALLPALRVALGALYGNPGTMVAVLADLRRRARLVPVRDRLCLRDPAAPIALPPGHELLVRADSAGEVAGRLLLAVAVLGDLGVDDLPLFADAVGADLVECGTALDQLAEHGVFEVDRHGRVRCRCAALAEAVIERGGADVARLHADLAAVLLDRRSRGLAVDEAALADHVAAAGPYRTVQPEDVVWLLGQADATGDDLPERASRWYRAVLRHLSPAAPRYVGTLRRLLRLLMRAGDYPAMSGVLAEIDPAVLRQVPGLGPDLCVAAMLTSVHIGPIVPGELLAALEEDFAHDGVCRAAHILRLRWFDRRIDHLDDVDGTDAVDVPADTGEAPLMSAAELNLVRYALAGDPRCSERAWRRLRPDAADTDYDLLLEAGWAGDLAGVFAVVLGRRYRVPHNGVLAVYQRTTRAYAGAQWSSAMAAVRELELTGAPDTIAHHAARLCAAEICSARGDLPGARAWLAAAAPDIRFGALRGWVEIGLSQSRNRPAHGLRVARRMRGHGVLAGMTQLLTRSVAAAVSMNDTESAATLLTEIEDLHRSVRSRTTMESVFLARAMVRGDLADVAAGAGLARDRGNRSELIQTWLAVAQLTDDPQDVLREAYEVARQCDSPLLREYVRAISRERGLTAPRARITRDAVSRTERRIIGLIRDGLTNRQIAGELGVSEKTVENHLTKLFAKTGCRSRVQLVTASLDGRLPDVVAS